VRLSESTNSRPATTSKPATELPTGGRMRMGVPDRPTDGAPTRYTDLRPTMPVRVVVREGDSLWTLAARELGPTATNGAIAARWPDWYAANRQVIGDDPDLIFPGQVLRVPPASTGDHVPPTHQEK
jgi:nucleoid-associated protein YgaU